MVMFYGQRLKAGGCPRCGGGHPQGPPQVLVDIGRPSSWSCVIPSPLVVQELELLAPRPTVVTSMPPFRSLSTWASEGEGRTGRLAFDLVVTAASGEKWSWRCPGGKAGPDVLGILGSDDAIAKLM